MKKILLLGLAAVMSIFVGCSDDNDDPNLVTIDAATLTATPGQGTVKLAWTTPDNANYKYLRVTYFHPGTQKIHTRLASIYSDTLLVDNLLNRYGEITFTIEPVGQNGSVGEARTISATAIALPKVIRAVEGSEKRLVLTNGENDFYTDSYEVGDGSKAGLIDNNDATYFHMSWSNATPFPHYIVMKLPETIDAFTYYFKGRNHNNRQQPKTMNIWVTDAFDGNFTPATQTGAYKVNGDTPLSGFPDGKGAAYNSPQYFLPRKYQYIWFEVLTAYNSHEFIAMAEWHVTKLTKSVYDPETGETTTE